LTSISIFVLALLLLLLLLLLLVQFVNFHKFKKYIYMHFILGFKVVYLNAWGWSAWLTCIIYWRNW
jgi:hypothetical protein